MADLVIGIECASASLNYYQLDSYTHVNEARNLAYPVHQIMDIGLSARSVYCLGFNGLQFVISLIMAFRLGRNLASKADKGILVWLVYDAFVHFTIEAVFVIYSVGTTIDKTSGAVEDILLAVWREYGLADSRWIHADPTIVSLEILTVFLCGAMCIILIEAIINNRPYRHFIQITLCVCELYGGWMTFCPEWLTGSPSLNTSKFIYLWCYLVFFNMLWVVLPVYMLYQSWMAVREAGAIKAKEN